jgi:hypothetical protein
LEGVWPLTSADTKTAKEHLLPLSPLVIRRHVSAVPREQNGQ